MSSDIGSQPVGAPLPPAQPKPKTLVGSIRSRILGGLLLALPVAITFWIIYWLYSTLRDLVVTPVAEGIVRTMQALAQPDVEWELAPWFENYVAPLIALAMIVMGLYFLGMFVHSRLHKTMDWILLRIPVVMTIYSSVRKVFDTLEKQRAAPQFKRVVLVPFPHPGTRVPGFVTASCLDVATGKTILCVYVPTTPVPTSGFMLMMPEEMVTEISWDLNETFQAIVSGGISVPAQVEYFPPGSTEPDSPA